MSANNTPHIQQFVYGYYHLIVNRLEGKATLHHRGELLFSVGNEERKTILPNSNHAGYAEFHGGDKLFEMEMTNSADETLKVEVFQDRCKNNLGLFRVKPSED